MVCHLELSFYWHNTRILITWLYTYRNHKNILRLSSFVCYLPFFPCSAEMVFLDQIIIPKYSGLKYVPWAKWCTGYALN